ncbi:hypothetical protein JYT28_00965 [Desulfobulbus sp. AH-315-M07]|nr:hypothetical protein [Desulfobulbus sp. AH-315-M07]
MTASLSDGERLAELRNSQLDFFVGWLGSERAEARWCKLVAKAQASLVERPLAHFVEAERLRGLIAAATSGAVVSKLVVPAARTLLMEVAARVHARSESTGELLSEETWNELAELVADPDVVNEPLLRALLEDPAVEAVMHDVLFDALKEFGDRLNPFVAEWGLPALIDGLPMLGKGVMLRAIDGVRKEFDKRSRPEMRKFLKVFSRRAVKQSIEQTLIKRSEPEMVALRQHLATAVLERPLSEMCWSPEEDRGRRAVETIAASIGDVLTHAIVAKELERAVDDLLAAWGERPVSELFDAMGVTLPDTEPFARAMWPAIKTLGSSDAIREILTELIDDSHAQWLENE